MPASTQQVVYAAFPGRAILVHPGLARRLGPSAALLLGQLLYWEDRKQGEAVFKTIEEMKEETGLSRAQQETAIEQCAELGILSVILRGIPAKRHFTVNTTAILSLPRSRKSRTPVGPNAASSDATFQQTSLREPNNTDSGEVASSDAGSPQTTSESTQESTTESTAERKIELARNRRALDRVRGRLESTGTITSRSRQS